MRLHVCVRVFVCHKTDGGTWSSWWQRVGSWSIGPPLCKQNKLKKRHICAFTHVGKNKYSHISFISHLCAASVCVWHDWFILGTWLVDMCDVTHLYVWHISLIRVTWLIDMCDMTHWYVWRDSLICVTWLIDKCDVTRWSVWRDSLICVMWLSLICVTCLIDMCDVTRVTWLFDMYDVTRWYVWRDSYMWHDLSPCDTTCPRVDNRSFGFGCFINATWLIRICVM